LDDVIDLRGKTTLRQTAAIISQSDAFVATSGFLAHLARAVDCRSVIIYGGREHSYQSGYSCNENLDSYIDCAPCWQWNGCEYNRRCIMMIGPERVFNAVLKVLDKRYTPLEIDLAMV
jgi:ADP-heptose:LPS heptosyltransferase